MTASGPERSILSSRVDAAAGAARVAPGETVVRYRYSSEAGTSCRHCGATYAKCTEDVLRELHDPKATDGCCDECRDASGHQVRTVLEDRVSVAIRPVADEERAADRAEIEQLRRCGAKHPTNPSIVACTLDRDDHADGLHWSSTGCAGSAVSWPTAEARLDALVADLRGLADKWWNEAHCGEVDRTLRSCADDLHEALGGCCTACEGTGCIYDPNTSGLCWDCRGTGHPHPRSDGCDHRTVLDKHAGEQP